MGLFCSFAVNLDEVQATFQCADIDLLLVLYTQDMLTDGIKDRHSKLLTCIPDPDVIVGRIRVNLNTRIVGIDFFR